MWRNRLPNLIFFLIFFFIFFFIFLIIFIFLKKKKLSHVLVLDKTEQAAQLRAMGGGVFFCFFNLLIFLFFWRKNSHICWCWMWRNRPLNYGRWVAVYTWYHHSHTDSHSLETHIFQKILNENGRLAQVMKSKLKYRFFALPQKNMFCTQLKRNIS